MGSNINRLRQCEKLATGKWSGSSDNARSWAGLSSRSYSLQTYSHLKPQLAYIVSLGASLEQITTNILST